MASGGLAGGQQRGTVRTCWCDCLRWRAHVPWVAGLTAGLLGCCGAVAQARQMAALFLRKKINTYWIRLTDEHKTVTKRVRNAVTCARGWCLTPLPVHDAFLPQTILERLAAEPERSIRRALAGCVAPCAVGRV